MIRLLLEAIMPKGMVMISVSKGMGIISVTSPIGIPSAGVPPVDVDALINNAIRIGAQLPGYLGALFVVVAVIGYSLFKISKFFSDENERRDDAWKESKRLEAEHNSNMQRIANDYAKAAGDLLGDEYKKDFEWYIVLITQKNFEPILLKVAKEYHKELSTFLYDENISPRDRAARVIHLASGKPIV